MIGKKQAFVWLGAVIVLALLYLVSSTDLIIKEEEPRIYRVSVVLDDATDEAYGNFGKGIEEASRDYQMDVNVISLYNAGDAREQAELISRELQDDVDAMIVISVEDNLYTQENAAVNVPVIYLQDEKVIGSHINQGTYSFNWMQIGEDLAQRAAGQGTQEPQLVFISGTEFYGRREQIVLGAQKILGEKNVVAITIAEGEHLESRIRTDAGESANRILVGMDNRGIEKILAFLPKMEEKEDAPQAVYSMTGSVLALNSLRRGIIDGVFFTDDYTAGYQCMQVLRERLDNVLTGLENLEGRYYFLDMQDLNNGEYDRLLYPME